MWRNCEYRIVYGYFTQKKFTELNFMTAHY